MQRVPVADLGIGRHVDQKTYVELHQNQKYGNPPEAKDGIFHPAGDVWTVGAAVYRLLTNDVRQTRLYDRVDDFTSKLDAVGPEAKDFVLKCLQLDPKDRMTSEEALRHPWFYSDTARPILKSDKILQYMSRIHFSDQFKLLATSVSIYPEYMINISFDYPI